MTINEAMDTVDVLQPNTFSRTEKLAWLSRAEGLIKAQILDTCVDAPDFAGYGPDTDPDTVLLLSAPWDEIYLRYLQAQMDLANGEVTRYENSAALYNRLFAACRNHYNRTHVPRHTGWQYF